MVTLEWDSRSLAPFQNARGGMQRALVSALRKAGGDALRAMRAESKRQVRDRVRIRAGFLANKALPLDFPRASTIDGLVWVLRVSGAAVPLGEYPRRQTRKGVSVEVVKGQRRFITGAFLARTKSGRKGVFLRPTGARYPMGHRLGLRVSDSMADGRIPTAVLARAQSVFATAAARLIPLEMSKAFAR